MFASHFVFRQQATLVYVVAPRQRDKKTQSAFHQHQPRSCTAAVAQWPGRGAGLLLLPVTAFLSAALVYVVVPRY